MEQIIGVIIFYAVVGLSVYGILRIARTVTVESDREAEMEPWASN